MRKEKIVVSLTSYPKRINEVHKVIESLWKQRVNVDEILLYLSILEFPKRENDIPESLHNIIGEKNFNIVWVDDNLKSHKKYFYALQEKRDSIVITVDDDMIYSDTLISDLLKGYKKFPNAISARRARIILKDNEGIANYKEWDGDLKKYAYTPRKDLCAIGVGGVLYPPGCASEEWFIKDKIKELAENQDDLWLKYNELKKEIAVVYVESTKKDITVSELNIETLSSINLYEGKNDICIGKLIIDAKRNNFEIYKEWLKGLMTVDEYNKDKKDYYNSKVKISLKKYENIDIYIFGAGKIAKAILRFLIDCKLEEKIKAVVVSDVAKNPISLYDKEVIDFNNINPNVRCCIIYGVSNKYKSEIENRLHNTNFILLDLEIDSIIHNYM